MGSQSLFESILSAGPITLAIFILLILLSVYTWGILLSKLLQFRQEELENEQFFLRFNQEADLKNLHRVLSEKENTDYPTTKGFTVLICETCRKTLRVVNRVIKPGLLRSKSDTPCRVPSGDEDKDLLIQTGLTAIFCETYSEVLRITNGIKRKIDFLKPESVPIKKSIEDSVERTLSGLKEREYNRLMHLVSILATTSTAAPFIGLLGTVIGIINAFKEIGKAGSADLAFVAPAISDALIATALGLMVAIPALVGFNYLKVRSLLIRQGYNRFGLQLQNRIQQQFIIGTKR